MTTHRMISMDTIRHLMQDYAELTGLEPALPKSRRYLWTDAFGVCNYLGLYRKTGDGYFRDLALRLVDQVHHTLGQHREDDPRTGWISGLTAREGEMHPTIGGLRIGKPLPERGINERYDESREWNQDGQYFHYLSKWMHALNCVSRVIGSPDHLRWAIELAKTAHTRFTYLPKAGGRKRMYWKMSIDLTRPFVPSMGQHDPIDGLVTYSELQMRASRDFSASSLPPLVEEIEEMGDIVRGIGLYTDDPLGIGGLLSDGVRAIKLMGMGCQGIGDLPECILDAALIGLQWYHHSGSLEYPARYRLAFRELGLSIGLSGIEKLAHKAREYRELPGTRDIYYKQAPELLRYLPLRENIENFWLDTKNQEAETWMQHREINTVMLATSLAPDEFLLI